MGTLPISPFRRAGADIASSGDPREILEDKIRQICLTEPGELPWRPEFGAGLEGLLHRNNDLTTAELARFRARMAIDNWIPGEAEGLEISASRSGTSLRLAFRYRISGAQSDTVVELSPSGVVS